MNLNTGGQIFVHIQWQYLVLACSYLFLSVCYIVICNSETFIGCNYVYLFVFFSIRNLEKIRTGRCLLKRENRWSLFGRRRGKVQERAWPTTPPNTLWLPRWWKKVGQIKMLNSVQSSLLLSLLSVLNACLNVCLSLISVSGLAASSAVISPILSPVSAKLKSSVAKPQEGEFSTHTVWDVIKVEHTK